MIRAFATVLRALALVATPVLAQEALQAGQWELSIDAVAGNGMKNQQTLKQCINEADARDPSRVLSGAGGASACSFPDKRTSGSHMEFRVSCEGVLPLSGNGSVDYTATTLDGTITLEFSGQGAQALPGGIRSHITGRRVGSC